MNARELGDILIKAFEECSLEEIVMYQENGTIDDFLKIKVGEEKHREISKAEPLVWMEAIRTLYLSK
ncbi:MAG: hypothetical protein AB1815_03840 [Bacillota bacterium]|jgi:hypothetical protein